MNRLPLIVFCIVAVTGIALLFFGNLSDTKEAKLQALIEKENRDLFLIEEVSETEEQEDFVSGAPYLIFDNNGQREITFIRSEEDELGKKAIFSEENGEEIAFYGKVLFSVKGEKDVKEVNQAIKENPNIVEFKEFKALNMYAVSFETPYQAYLQYLTLAEDERLIGVGLDMKVTAYNDEEQGVMIQ